MQPLQKRTVRAVIFNPEGKLLLMERHKNEQHYFVLPGGHVEDLEAPEWAVMREVKEETGLDVSVAKLLYQSMDGLGNQQKIYLCNYHGGEPVLPLYSQEAEVDHQTGQLHRPAWFAPEELRGKAGYPVGLLDALEKDILHDFADNPKKL